MTSGRKSRANRKANPKSIKEKIGTPWYMRNSLVTRQGRGNQLDQMPGTPKSAKQIEKLTKIWNRIDPEVLA